MSENIQSDVAEGPLAEASDQGPTGRDALGAVLRWMLMTATAWYLLKELAPLLRPLLLAVFLAYIILPMHWYLKGQIRGGVRHLALLAGLVFVLLGLAVLTYGDIVDLSRNLPRLHDRAKEVLADVTQYTQAHIPGLDGVLLGTFSAEEQGSSRIKEVVENLATLTAGVLAEAIQVVFFLALILVETGRLPRRTRAVFASDQADRILTTVGNINAAIASYLKVKVRASVVLAIPAMLVLWLAGIQWVVLWGTLTFFANFVPYLGSVVACSLPLLFGFFDLGLGWRILAASALLPVVHVTSAYLVEPAMTGKAVDLSPLVVLIALAFWGLCWGLTGMILAVPLTAMLKIILDSTPRTRPFSGLMGGE
jgi:AI-2 transport protein TqsA